MFEYLYLRLFEEDVQPELSRRGAEGWRVCSFEPVVVPGNEGATFSLSFAVVMDRARAPDEERQSEGAEDGTEGMRCRG